MKLPSNFKYLGSLTILVTFFVLLLLGTNSCKSKDQKKVPDKDTTTVLPADTARVMELEDTSQLVFFKTENKISAADADDEIYNLTLTAETLDKIFKTNWKLDPVVALRFDFYKLNGKRALYVCGVNDNDTRCTNYYELKVTETGTQRQGNLHRTQHYFTRGQMRQFLGMGSATGPLPPNTRFINMYFRANPNEDPRWPGDKLIFFNINDDQGFRTTSGPIQKLDVGEGITNPSPPFTAPCGESCDAETLLKVKK